MRIEGLEGRALFVAAFGSEFVCAQLPADGAQQAVTYLPVHAAQTAALGGTLQGKSPQGTLAETYETGGRDSATISGGQGEPGGKLYGIYQFSSRDGTVNAFLRQYYRGVFKGLRAGTTEFDAKWTRLAAERPEELRLVQHDFFEAAHYDVLAGRLDRRYGDALSGRSEALGEVIWSVSVQHGPKTPLVQRALEPFADAGSLATADDAQLIEAIYDEREREDRRGNLVYFRRSSEAVQDGVRDRFEQERADALALLESESTPPPTPTPTPPEPGPTPTPTAHPEPTPTATVNLDAPQVAGRWSGTAYQDADAGHTTAVFTVSLHVAPYESAFFAAVFVDGGGPDRYFSWQTLEHTLDENGVNTFIHSLDPAYGGPKLTVTVSVGGSGLTGRWHITPADGQPSDPATMNGSVVPP